MRLHRTTRRRRRLHAQLHPSTQHTFEAFVHHHHQHLRLCLPLAVIAAYNIYIYDSYARQHTHHTHISYMHAGGIADYNSTPSRFVYVVNCVWTMQYRRFVKIHWQSVSERNTIDLCPPYIKHTQYTHIAHTHNEDDDDDSHHYRGAARCLYSCIAYTSYKSRRLPARYIARSLCQFGQFSRQTYFFLYAVSSSFHTHTVTHRDSEE